MSAPRDLLVACLWLAAASSCTVVGTVGETAAPPEMCRDAGECDTDAACTDDECQEGNDDDNHDDTDTEDVGEH